MYNNCFFKRIIITNWKIVFQEIQLNFKKQNSKLHDIEKQNQTRTFKNLGIYVILGQACEFYVPYQYHPWSRYFMSRNLRSLCISVGIKHPTSQIYQDKYELFLVRRQ